MNLDSLNKWLTLLANIGVLLGIFALVIELDQSTRLAEANAYQARNSELQDFSVQMANSPELLLVLNKYWDEGLESLNNVEINQVSFWNRGVLFRMENQYYQYMNGFLGEQVIQNTMQLISNFYYEQWSELGLLENISIPQWREEIERRVN